MSDDENKILLETGTNKFQYAEFMVGPNFYGINIAKVKEFLRTPKLKALPKSHPAVPGVFKLRSDVMMLIDLAKFLNIKSEYTGRKIVIVTEFNSIYNGFLVDKINDIYTTSWKEISTVSESSEQTLVTGVISKKGKIVFILDCEKILSDVYTASPKLKIKKYQPSILQDNTNKSQGKINRSNKKIIIAEDSSFTREIIKQHLTQSGYHNIESFINGKQAWDILNIYKNKGNINDYVDLIITDIEMPLMDGQHLVKKIRADKKLKNLPIIIYTSLSNELIKKRSLAIGADAQISKPELKNLVTVIDHLLLKYGKK